ncbi:MAG: prepilin-type N-terminal cleavage/methylation domain-containing protein [Verrucomicrobiales bacterium]|jgi:prepilin-type N-terminal cleavage/methylation domain-containing protein|nr:prepilin-type N-terminal cleavage/methylation domain-containing protein [Verrucomicrobiales bacterium]
MPAPRSSLATARGFTLTEILVAVTVLLILVALVAQLFNSTTRVTNLSNSHLDADNTARLLFARMAADFSRIVKRVDVDYYLKGNDGYSSTDSNKNDQLAFYCEVPGYSSSGGNTSNSISLVAYRLNSGSTNQRPYVERMSKALPWSNANSQTPAIFLPLTISSAWPTAISSTATDSDYEVITPNIIRFEYDYLLRNGTLSATPWIPQFDSNGDDTGTINGLKDVTAIGVTIAVLDRKSATIMTTDEAVNLASQMRDFQPNATMGQLEQNWQSTVNSSSLPAPKKGGVYIYSRLFYLSTFAN